MVSSRRNIQPKLPLRMPTAQHIRPEPSVVAMAKQLAGEHGRTLNIGQFARLQGNPRVSYAIAEAYQNAEKTNTTDTPALRASYEALGRDIEHHYNMMTAPIEQGGLGFTVEVTEHDPYTGTSKQFMKALQKDIRKRHIKVLSTAATGGHGFFTNELNDKFRAVHDLFGHIGSGRGFSRHGEEAAWRLHTQMVSPEAVPAITSELRGQNAYMINKGRFPEQTSNLIGLPEWAHSFDEPNLAPPRKRTPKADQPQLPGVEW